MSSCTQYRKVWVTALQHPVIDFGLYSGLLSACIVTVPVHLFILTALAVAQHRVYFGGATGSFNPAVRGSQSTVEN